VLTAHPTEAKRRTVLSKLQRISELLRHLQDADALHRSKHSVSSLMQCIARAIRPTAPR